MTDEKKQDLVLILCDYVKAHINGQASKSLYQQCEPYIEQVTPDLAFDVFYTLYQAGYSADTLLSVLDRVMNVFHQPLLAFQTEAQDPQSFIGWLDKENKALIEKLEAIKPVMIEKKEHWREQVSAKIDELSAIRHHYTKKENILFPYMEKAHERYQGTAIMWALHDQARQLLQETKDALASCETDEKTQFQLLGRLFFILYGLTQKEAWILFPAALSQLTDAQQQEMLRQSLEYEWAFIAPPLMNEQKTKESVLEHKVDSKDADLESDVSGSPALFLQSETGNLSLSQLKALFAALPVDLTFVDENDTVQFFTRPKDRIFPRSPAIIGRSVKNCHPPQSLDKVMAIIDAFRAGRQSQARFWIQLHGRFILIQYFALRDTSGQYKGTLEVSQDITEIKQLTGQQRLLDWSE